MSKKVQFLKSYTEPLDPVSNTEGGVLAKFWRNILNETNLSKNLTYLFHMYEVKANKYKGKMKSKSTVIQNATSSEMTFKVFLDLLINLLNVKKIKLNIELTFQNDMTTLHTIDISPNVVNQSLDEDILDIINNSQDDRSKQSEQEVKSKKVKHVDTNK